MGLFAINMAKILFCWIIKGTTSYRSADWNTVSYHTPRYQLCTADQRDKVNATWKRYSVFKEVKKPSLTYCRYACGLSCAIFRQWYWNKSSRMSETIENNLSWCSFVSVWGNVSSSTECKAEWVYLKPQIYLNTTELYKCIITDLDSYVALRSSLRWLTCIYLTF